MIRLPLITHLIMVAHEVLPIKNNGLPKKKLIFILGHYEWPREIKNFIHQNAIFIFPQCFFLFSVLWNIYKTILFQLPVLRMTTTQRFPTVTEAFRKHWVEGFKPKNPLWGERGVWIVYTFLEPHSILKNICMLFPGHIQLGTLWSENGDV